MLYRLAMSLSYVKSFLRPFQNSRPSLNWYENGSEHTPKIQIDIAMAFEIDSASYL